MRGYKTQKGPRNDESGLNGVTDIILLFLFLLAVCCLTEFLFHKLLLEMGILKKKNRIYHAVGAGLRILWVCLCAWAAISLPVFLIGLLFFLYLNAIPYRIHTLLISHFIIIIHLTYTSLVMSVIGIAGLLNVDVAAMIINKPIRILALSTTLLAFDIICFLLLHYHPRFFRTENADRFKALTYTCFLIICIIYHLFDAVILVLYPMNRVNYLLLVSGDILILILMYNFLTYNYVFEKSKRMKKELEENEILIAQQYFEKEELKKLSEYDALTHAYNRREISEIMHKKLESGHKLSCIFIDLDGLKRANDTYGHAFGDLMLKRFADACAKILQDDDCLARIGGDEFLLVFPDQEMAHAESRIRQLQQTLLEPASEKDKIYFSYGISYGEESASQYIQLADQRMYECKNRKRCENR